MRRLLPYSDVVTALSHALDLRGGQRPGHSVRTALIGMEIGAGLQLSEADRSDLYYALLLTHRGGSFLEAASRREIDEASDLALDLGFSPNTALAIRHAGERWNGTGRPEGLSRSRIPLLARICAVARVTDRALTEGGVPEIQELLSALRGSRLDPHLVDLVLSWAHREEWWADVRASRRPAALHEVEPDRGRRLLGEDEVDRMAETFARVIDTKSSFTYDHSRRVGEIARAIGRRRGVSDREARRLYRAGLLHDIGKLALPNLLLHKPQALSPEQVALIRSHPLHSYEILRYVEAFSDVAALAAYHHERLDGTGYPWGVAAESLDEACRTLAVADMYEALTVDRPYRPAMSVEQALDVLRTEAKRRVDPELVETLAGCLDAEGRLLPDPPAGVVSIHTRTSTGRPRIRSGNARQGALQGDTCLRWGWVRVS
ncbi:MAG: HD domain-containing protein [Gemmatimonadales bacterium]|nr:MAG: HD domain-containing protein [Gemmatimonadales bacterium]